MWLKFTRAVSIEAETVGERQKKNVPWSDRMKEENKNEAKHSTLHKAFFQTKVFAPYNSTFTLIALFSS